MFVNAFVGQGHISKLSTLLDTKEFDNYNLKEVELILQKKSNLPSAKRKQIMIWFNQNYEEVK
jgi:hypothetical protein